MRGVEKKSIATSDTRFVENIQKNGIRVEINDAYRMYKQYVLFSDAKTPSRRDCSFFFYTGRIRRFADIVFYDTTTWLIGSFVPATHADARASERPAKRCARFTTRSYFFFVFRLLVAVRASRAPTARFVRVGGTPGKARAGLGRGRPGDIVFRAKPGRGGRRDGVDDATGFADDHGGRFSPERFVVGVARVVVVVVANPDGGHTRCRWTCPARQFVWGGAAGGSANSGAHGSPRLGSNRPTDRPMDRRPRARTHGRTVDGRKKIDAVGSFRPGRRVVVASSSSSSSSPPVVRASSASDVAALSFGNELAELTSHES